MHDSHQAGGVWVIKLFAPEASFVTGACAVYTSILVAIDIDDPQAWSTFLPTARALADHLGAKLALVHVVSEVSLELEANRSSFVLRNILETARARLLGIANEFGITDPDAIHLTTGTVHHGVLETAAQIDADLIVIGSHRPGLKDYLIGQNAERLVRHAPVSVLVVK